MNYDSITFDEEYCEHHVNLRMKLRALKISDTLPPTPNAMVHLQCPKGCKVKKRAFLTPTRNAILIIDPMIP